MGWEAFRRPDLLFRTATFRLTLGLVFVIVLGMGLQLALLCWQMNAFDRHRTSELLRGSAEMLAQDTPAELEIKLRDRSTNELRVLLNGAGLFDPAHHHIAGDIRRWPPGLKSPPPEQSGTQGLHVQRLTVTLPDGTATPMRFLVVRVPGPEGTTRLLVVERSRHMADELRLMARKAAMYSVVPVVLFALLAGLFLSQRAQARIKVIHEALERIMKGDLHERLPMDSGRDDLQLLARSVNRMLDRLEQLMNDLRDVGNSIAHDLRTPLARVQARLDRAAALSCECSSQEASQLEEALLRCRADLEQCFSVITAILRIGEIESGQRLAGFADMALQPFVTDIADLYEPMAEAQGITLTVSLPKQPLRLFGDADLLNEVLANLLDNALKFTPEGGKVELRGGISPKGESWLEVRDTGMGIPPSERAAVLGRFYRADKSRHVPGSGLGLSLVAAIVRLHEARLEIEDNTEINEAQTDQGRGAVFRVCFPSRL